VHVAANGGGTVVQIGDGEMNVRRAADAAVELAQVVKRVRVRHRQRADREEREVFPPPMAEGARCSEAPRRG
jgi:hypothetical protein